MERWKEERDEQISNPKKKHKKIKNMFCVKQRCVPKIFRLLLGFYYIPGQRRTEPQQRYRQCEDASMCAKAPPTCAGQGYSCGG